MGNWASHVSGLGPSFMKIWICGSPPRSGSRNACKRIKNVNGASCPSKFWIFFGAIQIIFRCDWWPWTKPGYITMTRRQSSNQWSGGIAAHPAPQNSECKNPLEKFSPWFCGIKTASFSLIIFQRAKLSTQSITHLYWCNWRTFWRKNAAGRSPRWSCSCTKMPRLTGHLQPRRKWHTRAWSPTLFSGFGPVGLFPRLKKQLKGRHFSSDAEVIAAAETWLDFFFLSNGLRSVLSFVGIMLNKSRVWSL